MYEFSLGELEKGFKPLILWVGQLEGAVQFGGECTMCVHQTACGILIAITSGSHGDLLFIDALMVTVGQ